MLPGDEMVELVRRSTDLNYDKCKVAVTAVLSHLKYSIPAVSSLVTQVLSTLEEKTVVSIT